MNYSRWALLLLGCNVLVSAAGNRDIDKPDPGASGMSARRLANIPARMKEFVDSHQTAGVVTIVGRRGKVASFEAVGYQDVESHKPMQKNSLFRIASLTKPITCAGVMVLVDEGKLSVADPVEKYLPEYQGMKVNNCSGLTRYGCEGRLPSRSMTIEDLMVHTSGLESTSDSRGATEPSTLGELAVLGARTQLLFEPGTKWNYSNIGYNILGRIIEVVSKQQYDAFLQEHIFDPLGMKETYFFLPEEKRERLATLYTLTGEGLKRAEPLNPPHSRIPMPAGGLVSRAEDIFRFNMMMRNKGTLDGERVLSSAAVTLMTTSHTGEMEAGWVRGVGHGYGYEVVRNAEGMFRYNSIGSFVKGGAFRTYEWVDPEKDLVGVFMMQLTNGGGDMADEINRVLAISASAIE